MKYVNNSLYLEWKEALDSGLSENTLKNAKLRKSPSWSFIDDPEDKRKVLIEFEKLKDDYKKKVVARFGNPYEFMAKKPIRDLIKWDEKAEEFYLAYRYDEDKPLSIEHVKKYTSAASMLNMLKYITSDKKQLKKILNLSLDQFYTHVIEIIKTDKLDLPSSYRRLLATCKEYNETGYSALIDWRFGNKLAAKIKDELSESVLLAMIEHPDQYDDVFIGMQYNRWAKEHNYKEIDEATVGVWRRKKEAEVTMSRAGNSALKGKFLRQAKGFRPTAPLYLVESDDNHLDLLFEDPDDPQATKRYIAIVVTDSFNDYVLGYAYALAGELKEGQSLDLVRAAYTNAMYYIRSITSSWYLPHEIKTDRWGLKNLQPFYESIGKYFPTPVGSKNRGYIENFFGSHHWKRCMKINANNYSGNNMTAKNRGVNVEVVARNKKVRPLIGNEAINQIENFFHRLRHMEQTNGVSKHAEWMEAFHAMSVDKKRKITDEQYLLNFGVVHNEGTGRKIRITNRAVEPQISGVRYSYDFIETDWMKHVGKEVQVHYDPYDMSRILVTGDQVRLMATEARLNPRALEDGDVNSRTYLNAVLQERKRDVEYIAAKVDKRKQILAESAIDAETLLTSGVMVKEIKQSAEHRLLEQTVNPQQYPEDLYDQM